MTYESSVALHLNGETVEIATTRRDIRTATASCTSWSRTPCIWATCSSRTDSRSSTWTSGGTVDGYLRNVEAVLARVDENTVIVLGHGGLANRADLRFATGSMR